MNELENMRKFIENYNEYYKDTVENIRKSMENVNKNYTENIRKVMESVNKEAIASFSNAFINLNEINKLSKVFSKNIEFIGTINANLLPLREIQEISKLNLEELNKNFQQINKITVENFRIPSLVTENISASLRAISESVAYPDKLVGFPITKVPEEDKNELNELLSKLDSHYIKMRESAWEALNSNNVEKLRHSLVSMRELVYQVLNDLAPNNAFNTRPKDITIRMRIKHIISSDSDTKLIESIIDIAENLCSCLSKLHAKIHKIENFSFNVKLYLQTADFLLLLILSKAKL